MLLFTVENTANTVCKLPVGGSAPPKDRAAAAVASVGRRIWLIRYGTIKALRVYQRNVPYLPNTFRPAVIQYLQLCPFPKCPAQLIQVLIMRFSPFPAPQGNSAVRYAAHFCRLHTCQNSIHGQYAEWRHHRPTLREAYSALARLPHGHIPFTANLQQHILSPGANHCQISNLFHALLLPSSSMTGRPQGCPPFSFCHAAAANAGDWMLSVFSIRSAISTSAKSLPAKWPV